MGKTKAYELRGSLKPEGQDLKLHSEGGGQVWLEFDEGSADAWYEFRKAARGKALRILVEIVD